MLNKLIAINKPTGLTSSDVVVRVRGILSRYYGEKVKVGHMGTLDPGAAGVLIVGVNKAARLFDVFLQKNKSYVGRLTFGKSTDTLDSYGKIISESNKPTQETLLKVLPKFFGEIEQVPPKYSAIKINGQKAYKMARQNLEIEIPTRLVTINNLEIISMDKTGEFLNSVDLKINCSSGTYIRTLFVDIAKACGVEGYMAYLIRDSLHTISINDSVTLSDLELNPDKYFINPLDVISDFMPVLELNDKEYTLISTGRECITDLQCKLVALTYNNELKFIGSVNNGKIKSITNLE